jgi:exopolysaccharide biosynthesis protein
VIDGRRQGWSVGVTLEEAQDKLLEFKVRDAYNLDGGGSSTFYYDGKVLNRPSDGRERVVTTNIVVLP